ncbi:peptidoglycan-binding protein [Hahella aquimaris]|uniref:peptidoglycan-binding protein n=1 Tax=Hahella sp. HNIBRBA332 TaxID=3015983 RepID=UPI00273CEC06|nr:peptidoglycan-binding protein [Hahella sp. HNIBRBA332]WLQ13318.1 peptidoglycan-binding protein [Hahella sp. HNIBRBA332]
MIDPLTSKWLPRDLKRELQAIDNGTFISIYHGKGPRSRLVQEWLNLAGHHIAIDSDFGQATELAVRAFRAQNNLSTGNNTVDGKVDSDLFRILIEPMLSVLQPLPPINGSLGSMVVEYANNHLQRHPVEVGGQNRGPWVRLYMNGKEGYNWPWCAGFVTFILRQACDTLRISMPIKGSFSCDSLAAQAQAKGLFVSEAKRSFSNLSDVAIFLNRRTSTDWIHTGFVTRFSDGTFDTIEGNTNDEGSREGYEVCARIQGYKSKDFICLY